MGEIKRKPSSDGRKLAFERRRRKGYEAYLKRKHKEMSQREKEKKKLKEKEKKKKERERLKKEKEKNKRPVGRPKKRGPKKKKKKNVVKVLKTPGRKTKSPFTFKIISCRNGKQNKFIGKYRTSEDAYIVFNELKKQDENIILPSVISVERELKNSIDEYILIEKTDLKPTLLRNEYGKLVEQTVNKKGWIVKDKFRYKKEETFWVYGYNSKNDRKTFSWIYNNIIINDLYYGLEYKRVILYKNKVIIKNDNDCIEMVLCKDESDAIRLYNKIEEFTKLDKIKQILFLGNYSSISDRRRKLENEIMSLTGWTKKKVQMKNTTYYQK